MAKVIGGGFKSLASEAGLSAGPAKTEATIAADATNKTMAEELAIKKAARVGGSSRMLLSDAKINPQQSLSATTTLG